MHAEASIPLLSRRRVAGCGHGTLRALRRGSGGDVAGSRTYVPGDDVRAIDRLASARVSSALGRDEFVVREHYAEESTHVILLEDGSPSMRLFPPGLPWLRKPDAVAETRRLLRASARRARCRYQLLQAPDVAEGLRSLLRARIGTGTFVFVLSDFLRPPPHDLFARALARGLDVVPVVVQDATWEQSFPNVAGVVLHVVDPVTLRPLRACLTRADCRARERANRSRFAEIIAWARDLGLDAVVLSSHSSRGVYRQFREWSEVRRACVGRPR